MISNITEHKIRDITWPILSHMALIFELLASLFIKKIVYPENCL